MEFEWDGNKRLANIEKHGIDFMDADLFFASPYLAGPARTVDGEPRWLATGMIEDAYVTAIFARRDDAIRIISMRSARHAERKKHQAVFGN